MLFPLAKLLEGRQPLLTVQSDTSLRQALERMIEHDYSQLPVVDGAGNLVGMVSEQTIARKYYHLDGYPDFMNLAVGHVQTRAITMRPDDDLFDALERLKNTSAIVIITGQQPVGIITDYDTTRFFRTISEGLVLVQDIEVSLRQSIETVFADEDARNTALIAALGESKKTPGQPNKTYERFTFGDTLYFMIHDAIWPQFQNVFEPKELFFKQLDAARKIRNQLAHFREGLEPVQQHLLLDTLQWIATRPQLQPAPATDDSAVDAPLADSIHSQRPRGKYGPLYDYLADQRQRVTTLSFAEIEALLGDTLPPSARQHQSWWGNDYLTHPQAMAWMRAGRMVENTDLAVETVTFRYSVTVLTQLFFADVLDRLKQVRPDATRSTRASAQSWFDFGAGRSGISFNWAFGYTTLRFEVYINTGDKDANKQIFDALHADQAEIEQQIGTPLEWERMDEKLGCRIFIARTGHITDPPEQIEAYKQWLLSVTLKFIDTFGKRIRALPR